MHTSHIFLSAVLALTVGCGKNPEQPGEKAPGGLRSVKESREEKGAGTSLKLEYPAITAGVEEAVRSRLNAAFAQSALLHLEQVEDDPIPFDEYAKNFNADHASMKGEAGASAGWSNESVMEIAHQGKSYVTTRCKTFTFTGGAHPNHFTHYEIYSSRDGRRIEFSDIVAEGRMAGLRAVVEKKLREIAGITSDQDLKEKGFQFTPGQLEIGDSVGLMADGALFHFNPYEIAAYALGHFDVPVAYKDLQGLLKPEYLP